MVIAYLLKYKYFFDIDFKFLRGEEGYIRMARNHDNM
jgi:hypothetical protein